MTHLRAVLAAAVLQDYGTIKRRWTSESHERKRGVQVVAQARDLDRGLGLAIGSLSIDPCFFSQQTKPPGGVIYILVQWTRK